MRVLDGGGRCIEGVESHKSKPNFNLDVHCQSVGQGAPHRVTPKEPAALRLTGSLRGMQVMPVRGFGVYWRVWSGRH